MAWMAFWASSSVAMVTNPNPRGRPLMRSTIKFASVTVPCAENASCRSFSVVLKEMFPTNSFVFITDDLLSELTLIPNCSRPPGFKSSPNRVHLKIYHCIGR